MKKYWIIYGAAIACGIVVMIVSRFAFWSTIVLAVIGLGVFGHVMLRNKKDKEIEKQQEAKSVKSKVVEDDFDSFVAKQDENK